MTWENRVVKTIEKIKGVEHVFYSIHEVYYDDNGIINGWTEEAVRVGGDSIDDIRHTLFLMKKSLERPILTEKGDKLI